MIIYCAQTRGNQYNTEFPKGITINNDDTDITCVKLFARFDHMAAKMKDSYRNDDNFLESDCIMLDLDNTHTQDPAGWKTLDDIAEIFEDVKFYAVRSRNYMKQKSKTAKDGTVTYYEPREKYHLYFPLSKTYTSKEEYSNMIKTAAGFYPYMDASAMDTARMFYGVKDPTVEKIDGMNTLDEFFNRIPEDERKQTIIKAIDEYEKESDHTKEVQKTINKLREFVGLEAPTEGDIELEPIRDGDSSWIDDIEQKKSLKWLEDWAEENNIDLGKRYIVPSGSHKNGIAICVSCLWDNEHSMDGGEKETVIIIDRGGKLNYLCRHSHGFMYSWKEFRTEAEKRTKENRADKTEGQAEAQPSKQFQFQSVSEYIHAGCFEKDIDYFKAYKERKTGYTNLDEYITLYPGLAFLGGASSLGKTTFAVNLIDQLASKGEHVLYFSLEQQKIEILTKSFARMIYERDPYTRLTNIDIKNGADSARLASVKAEYAERSKNIYIIKENFRTTAPMIRDTIESYIQSKGVRPIVVIDYLQLIAPPDEKYRGSLREVVDDNIKVLKDVQGSNELFMLVISSFNRSTSSDPVSYESFKETGMIEYTGDYIWGLQLAIQDEENEHFYMTTGTKGGKVQRSVQGRMAMIYDALKGSKREVELVSLKNRNGKQRFKCFFDYWVEHDAFVKADKPSFLDDKKGKRWYSSDNTDIPVN